MSYSQAKKRQWNFTTECIWLGDGKLLEELLKGITKQKNDLLSTYLEAKLLYLVGSLSEEDFLKVEAICLKEFD